MEKVFVYLSIIPWILFLSINIFKTLILLNDKKISALFRFDSIILILVFAYFVRFNRVFVIQMLFATINLYFFVNCLYEVDLKNESLKEVLVQNKFLFLLVYGLIIIFIIVLKKFLDII